MLREVERKVENVIQVITYIESFCVFNILFTLNL